MIRRFYVHNFRCLENFELTLADRSSVLLKETLQPNTQGTDFGAWFSGLLAYAPAAYGKIDHYLKKVMPDFMNIKSPMHGRMNSFVTMPASLNDYENTFARSCS